MTCAVLGKKTHARKATWTKFIHKACKQQDTNSLTHTHIFTHTPGRHMARTTQEGAASLKIMKIPLQPGAAQQAEAALRLHRRAYGGLLPTWLQRLLSAGRAP